MVSDQSAHLSRGSLLKMAWTAFLCAVGLSLTMPAMAFADSARFDIPAQPLPTALKAFASQAHMQLLYQYSAVAKAKGNAVSGDLEKHAALAQLLKDSGLEVIYSSDSAATIRPFRATSVKDDPGGSEPPPQPTRDSLQLAQTTPGQTSSASTVEKQDEKSSEKTKKEEQLQVVVVTGSRIPTASGDEAQPVYVYTREKIETSGQTSLGDFLNTLPQVSFQNLQTTAATIGGGVSVQLHGLPLGSTLVLIDGHPTNTGRFGFLDLGTIPVAAVARVEVIPVGSSAIYGSDALAGVVNIVLRNNNDGIEANFKGGEASGTNASDANLSVGRNWARGGFTLTADFQHQSMLLGRERGITSSGNLGPFNLASTDACFPGNVYSLTGQNLPGLTSTQAAIPANVLGTPTIQELSAGAGKLNSCSLFQDIALIPQQQQEGVLAAAHYDLADRVELFAQVLYSHKAGNADFGSVVGLFGGAFGASVLSASNPFNPFGQDVGISYAYPGALSDFAFDDTAVRPVIGLRGTLGGGWRWVVDALYSYERSRVNDSQTNFTQISNALASSALSTALNPFTSGPPASPQVLNSFVTPGRDAYDNSLASGEAFTSGPLFRLPSGEVDAVFGGEYSRYRESDNTVYLPAPVLLRRSSYALFTEARMPLIARHEQSGTGDTLTLSFAARYDHSNDYGGKATGQGGLEWRPYTSLLVRAAYGTAYRAPQLHELAGSTTSFPGQIVDPARGSQSYVVPEFFGPNPNLKPETGGSQSVGVVYASEGRKGLNVSLTWWKVDYTNYISTLPSQSLVDFPNLFPPGLITRAPPTANDIQQGFLGPITAIEDILVNYGEIVVAGFDLDASYSVQTALGEITPSLAVTETYRWDTALVPGAPEQGEVSQLQGTALAGFSPRWKGSASLDWARGAYSANLTGRYVGRYDDYTQFGGPQPHELGNFWLYDLNLRCDLGQVFGRSTSLKDSYFALGGVNIFNTLPQFEYVNGWDPNEADIRGRFLYAQVGKKW
jgi:iron complex outermembrane receptor protein